MSHRPSGLLAAAPARSLAVLSPAAGATPVAVRIVGVDAVDKAYDARRRGADRIVVHAA
jgi:hypothetical protein